MNKRATTWRLKSRSLGSEAGRASKRSQTWRAIGIPASTSFKTATIWDSVNRDFRMVAPSTTSFNCFGGKSRSIRDGRATSRPCGMLVIDSCRPPSERVVERRDRIGCGRGLPRSNGRHDVCRHVLVAQRAPHAVPIVVAGGEHHGEIQRRHHDEKLPTVAVRFELLIGAAVDP